MAEGVYLVLLLCLASCAHVATAAGRPNVLVLMADDLGYGDLGCYGNTTIPTPNIDGLAREGVLFTQALAAASVCTPSRTAFMTGRYPIRTGMVSDRPGSMILRFLAQQGGLPQEEVTMAKALLAADYNTSLVGKWHLGVSCDEYGDNCHLPIRHGFQQWYGIPLTNLRGLGAEMQATIALAAPTFYRSLWAVTAGSCLAAALLRHRSRLLFWLAALSALVTGAQLFFWANPAIFNATLMRNGEVVEMPIRLGGLTQRLVLETKRQLAEYQQRQRPFFHVHSFSKVHSHLTTAAEFRGRSQHGLYGDSVLELDWAVGEILATLQRLQLADNTLVYFTSDNGAHVEETDVGQGGSNAPLLGGKVMGGMEGGIRVPTLLRYPAVVKPGVVAAAAVSLMDLFPTVLALAGVDREAVLGSRVIDGRDLMPLVTGRTTSSPHELLFHYCGREVHALRWLENATTTWKVHFFWPRFRPGSTRCDFACLCENSEHLAVPRVYNIEADPRELRPLEATSGEYGRVVARCRRAVAEHAAAVEERPAEMTWHRSLWRPHLQPCCNPPWCRCTDPSYPHPEPEADYILQPGATVNSD